MAVQFRIVTALLLTAVLSDVSFAVCCCTGKIFSIENSIQAKIGTVLKKDIQNINGINSYYTLINTDKKNSVTQIKTVNALFANSSAQGLILKEYETIFDIQKINKLEGLDLK